MQEDIDARPTSMEAVIERLPPSVPENFKQQARLAVEFITILDSGQEITDPKVLLFQDQLQHTGFVGGVYVRDRFKDWYPTDTPTPEVALPKWLQHEGIQKREGTEAEWQGVPYAFEAWVNERGFPHRTGRWGEYYAIDESPSTPQETRHFKCYIENELRSRLEERRLDSLFEELKNLNLGPNEMKLFDVDRLVLYFHKDVSNSENIRKVFAKHKVEFRGPAQDVDRVKPDENGTLILDEVTSNDGALGEGGHSQVEYTLKNYNPTEFLDNYLKLCLWAGKDPSEPYKTSFVYLEDMQEQISEEKREAAINQASQMTGYPIMYARHRLDVIRK